MKKPIIFVIGFVILSSLIFISVVAFNFFTRSCFSWICAPERDFRISDLELPSNLFPEGTIVNHIYPLSDEFGTLEDGTQSIYWDNGNGRSGYTIYRYSNVRGAEKHFDLHKHLFVNSDTREEWRSPDNSTFSSTTADVVYIGCGYWSGKNRKNCTMVAQYQEYVAIFNATLDTKMTFDQFEKILFYIDKQISSLLYP
jgi:hypothetical protein